MPIVFVSAHEDAVTRANARRTQKLSGLHPGMGQSRAGADEAVPVGRVRTSKGGRR